MNIVPLKDLTLSSLKELNKFQSGKIKLVKTGKECIDCHIGGLLPGDICVVSGLSGHGKSQFLFDIKDNILNPEINEDAENFVFLDNNLEMKLFNIILRGVSKRLKKSKKSILFEEFTDEEKERLKHYRENLEDDRQFINQSPTTPDEFYNSAKEFLSRYKDKKGVFISVDHMLLLSGADKKDVIDRTVEHMNKLKLEFSNAYFIILSQMNRSLLARAQEKNNMAAPNTGDLYGSEFMNQVCSYNIVVFNPYKLGINQYLKVNMNQYDYLQDYFGESFSKDRVTFDTVGRLFFHVLKVREGDAVYKDLFIQEMDLPEEDKQKVERIKESASKDEFEDDVPKFEGGIPTIETPDYSSGQSMNKFVDRSEEDSEDDPF